MKKDFQRFVFASIIGSLVIMTGCEYRNGDMKDQNGKTKDKMQDQQNGNARMKKGSMEDDQTNYWNHEQSTEDGSDQDSSHSSSDYWRNQ